MRNLSGIGKADVRHQFLPVLRGAFPELQAPAGSLACPEFPLVSA